MAVEDLISKLTSAIEANTAALLGKGGTVAASPKAAATTTKATTTAIDFDAVKVMANKVMEAKSRPFAKKLIKDIGGAADLASVKKDKYAALMAAFEKAMEPAAAEPEAEAEEEDEL